MPTPTPPHPGNASNPSPEQRDHARNAMRGIGAQRRSLISAHFVCVHCETSWSGSESKCWNCGSHASIPYTDSGIPHLLLLHSARVPTVRRTAF